MKEMESKQKIDLEYRDMLETLQAAILVVQNSAISFENQNFK